MFKPRQTSDTTVTSASKSLVYALHGFGKTTQCLYYQQTFGKGFIISGEGGLASISTSDIDYLPFTSWDGRHDPEAGVYSFRGLCLMIADPKSGFQEMGYKWIAIDSLTEASDLLLREMEKKFPEVEGEKKKNGFKVWGEFAKNMIGSLKFIRDLPYHVLVTALAKDDEDDNGNISYWPHVNGKAVAKQIPALFDHVFAGHRSTERKEDGTLVVHRQLYVDEVSGYHGKIRDPLQRIPPVLGTSNIADVVQALHLNSDDFDKWLITLEQK